MPTRTLSWTGRAGLLAVAVGLAGATIAPGASGVPSVRGFDGTTIRTAGIGGATNFTNADLGTKARYQRANETNELKGIKLEYTEFADDKQDPATATSEVRRLVTQEGVFAIVPDLSAVNPGDYLNQQHVPYIGWAFDNTYCSVKPTTALYGFGYNGCLVPATPPVMPNNFANSYTYVHQKTGKKHPTIVLFSNDNQSGKNATRFQATSAQGAGFKVVYAKGTVPITTADYTPYVQEWLAAAGGQEPDLMYCLLTVQCLPILEAINAAGFKGTFQTPLYTDILVKPLKGTVASVAYNVAPNAGLTQMQKDLEAVKPGTKVSSQNAAAYFAADMLIQALKKVGKNITPEAVQKALANQTWAIKGLVGPTKYPASTVVSSLSCNTLAEDTDGTAWTTAEPYTCSSKTFKLDPKFKG